MISLLTLLLQILHPLRSWTQPIHDLQRCLDIAQGPSHLTNAGAFTRQEIILVPHASIAAIEARNDIYNLWRAFKHNTVARLLDIYTHAELTGLGVSCFAKVCFLLQW
jgi:hypothetical protein